MISKVKKINPYSEFQKWLNNSLPNAKLHPDVIKALSPRAILSNFCNFGGITIFLDKYFNKWDVMMLDPNEFYGFIKDIYKKNRLSSREFSYFSREKKKISLTEMHRLLPYLKRTEVETFLSLAEDDEEYNDFMASLGLPVKTKKIKLKKGKPKPEVKLKPKKEEPKLITMTDLRKMMGG